MIVFDMNGYIYPCELTDYVEERIGNIKDGDLLELINSAKNTKDYFKKKEETDCLFCSWKYFCKGGCSIKAKLAKSKIDKLECAINSTLYPIMIDSILNNPKLINKLLNTEIIGD